MSGKSVTLKTIVLNLFYGQMGFLYLLRSGIPSIRFLYTLYQMICNLYQRDLVLFGAEIIKLKRSG